VKRNEIWANVQLAFWCGLAVFGLFFCLCVVIAAIDQESILYLQFLAITGLSGLSVFVFCFSAITLAFAHTVYSGAENRTRKDAAVLAVMILLSVGMVAELGILWNSPFPHTEPEYDPGYAEAMRDNELARLTYNAQEQAFNEAMSMGDMPKEQMRARILQDLINSSYPPDIAKRAANNSVDWVPDDNVTLLESANPEEIRVLYVTTYKAIELQPTESRVIKLSNTSFEVDIVTLRPVSPAIRKALNDKVQEELAMRRFQNTSPNRTGFIFCKRNSKMI
jgi:hypothetical protein